MPYVPLNRVATDLYTDGGEYVYQNTQIVYVGRYHKYYNGEVYTNTTPDIPNPKKLIKILKLQEYYGINTDKIILGIGTETIHPDISRNDIEEQLQQIYQSDPSRIIENYLQAKNSSIEQYQPKTSIESFNPEPTLKNYEVGEVQRYFIKQINGLKYKEVDKNTYIAIDSRNPKYAWEYYITISLPWSITGEERQVMTTNKNIVELAERSRNITGLSQFLHNNYTKYYKYTEASNLYTAGGEFKTTNGQNYIGDYHIHDSKGPMVGKTHTKEPHGLLLPVNEATSPRAINQQTSIKQSQSTGSYSPTSMNPGGGGSGGGGSGGGGGY